MSATGLNADLSGKATGGRRLIAVVYADMVGYSRLISLDDAGTLRRLRTLRRALIDPAIREFGGKVVQTGGDSLLIAFDSIDGAVRCAVKVQQQVSVYDGDQKPDHRIRFRIGIDMGDAIPDGTDLHGDAVNIAARLEAASPVGGICLSQSVRDHVHGRLNLPFESIGPLKLKNIGGPVKAFVLRLDKTAVQPARPKLRRPVLLSGLVVLLIGVAAAGWLYRGHLHPNPAAQVTALPEVGLAHAPRLSLVVLPLNNLGGLDNDTVDGITEDLTTDIARIPGLLVIARNSAFTYKDKPIDIRRVGEELGVRYAVEGSARKNGDAMRVTIQLVSTETGSHILAQNYDIKREGANYNVDDVVHQVAVALDARLVDVESARSVRERSENPDVDDLVVRARAIRIHGFSPQTQKDVVALFERAVSLDPSSVRALSGLADAILDSISIWTEDPTAPTKLKRAEDLIKKAEALRPDDILVLWDRVFLLAKYGRYAEVIPAAQKAIELYPNTTGPRFWLGLCLMFSGKSGEAIVEFKQALRLNPRADVWARYVSIGYASLFLGRYDEAVGWFEKTMAANPNAGAVATGTFYAAIASAQALGGHIEEARHSSIEAMRLFPLVTARSYYQFNVRGQAISQIAGMRDGLRLAGIRDHADEDADAGVAVDDALHSNYEAPTPMSVPGARTIRTPDLQSLLKRSPLVLDVSWPWGKSVSGAVGLWGAGIGGSVTDDKQEPLRRKIADLTHGDQNIPIVTVGWNAERYQGRNLALRLVALGYTNVYWYRGGREAWEVAGLPETEVTLQEW